MILVSQNQSSKGTKPGESALDHISSLVAIPESIVLPINVSMILSMACEKRFMPRLLSHFRCGALS
jgi:hypothetical protein